MVYRSISFGLVALMLNLAAAPAAAQQRPNVGVAFGGGSARGIATSR